MQMTFGWSSSVMLLFDFWNVHSPAGMVLSVFIVLLLTVLFELLKAWRLWLGSGVPLHQPADAVASSLSESSSGLETSPSESSLTPIESRPRTTNKWTLHVLQTVLHMLQVTLGYMLMLCVMSYNSWIFIGVVVGAALGYFISFPLVERMSCYGSLKE
uniref:Copper transport protein n=1 Tax=Nothobranchius korthausae TaxID=1143690 RepID=A0A1A8GCJ6_9TELE